MTVDKNEVNGSERNYPANWVPVLEQTIFTPRKLRVVAVGAGFSGLMFAYHLRNMKMESFLDLRIYEKNSDVGGVWFENRYPGVACDVPAHIYTFSFEPNPGWSSFYASGDEIQKYIKDAAVKHDLLRNVQFESQVMESKWDEVLKKWKIRINHQGTMIEDEADVLVNTSGALNAWKLPKIEGLQSFQGKLVHTASWDDTINWEGKKVAVIGNGASGLQVFPKLQPGASKIVHHIRSPTWITANFLSDFAKDGRNFAYTEEEKRGFRENPEKLHKLRQDIEDVFNKYFYAFLKDHPVQGIVRDAFTQIMHERLNNDPELIRQLVPEFYVGCRRITPSDGYLASIQAPNATFDFGPILRVTESGIETEKGVDDFDLIVCATGFDTSFRPHWDVVGRKGISLNEKWKENADAYLGICAPDMPNYFMFVGPNSPVGHGDSLACQEWTAQYILKWCRKISTEDIRETTVKQKVVDDYNVYTQEFLKRTVWSAAGCPSWYKDGKSEGKVTAMYAGSIFHFQEMLENIRGEDFDICYNSKNMFRFMGNGLTSREEIGGNLGYYLKRRAKKYGIQTSQSRT